MRSKEKTVSKSKNLSKGKSNKSGRYNSSKKVFVHPQSILHKHKDTHGDYILKNVRSTTKKDKWGWFELDSIPASKEVPHNLHKKAVDVYVAMEERLVREVIKREGKEDIWLGQSGWSYTAMFYDPEKNNVNFEFTYNWDTWRTIEVTVYPDRYDVKVSVYIDGDSTESGKEAKFIPYHRKNIKKISTVVKAINENMYVDWAASK